MAANAEIQNGDRLVTSGIDGTYPPGIPVATVAVDGAVNAALLAVQILAVTDESLVAALADDRAARAAAT